MKIPSLCGFLVTCVVIMYVLCYTGACGLLFPICFACSLAKRLDENCCVPLCNGGIVALRVKTRMMFGIRVRDILIIIFINNCSLDC